MELVCNSDYAQDTCNHDLVVKIQWYGGLLLSCGSSNAMSAQTAKSNLNLCLKVFKVDISCESGIYCGQASMTFDAQIMWIHKASHVHV